LFPFAEVKNEMAQRLLLLAALVQLAYGHAGYLLQAANCGRALTAGTTFMGAAAAAGNGKTSPLSAAGNAGVGTYYPGEKLYLKVGAAVADNGQYVIEASAGVFDAPNGCGRCELDHLRRCLRAADSPSPSLSPSRRVANRSPTLTMPAKGTGAVTLKVAYAGGYGTVSIAAVLTLAEGTAPPPPPPGVPPPTPTPTPPAAGETPKPTPPAPGSGGGGSRTLAGGVVLKWEPVGASERKYTLTADGAACAGWLALGRST